MSAPQRLKKQTPELRKYGMDYVYQLGTGYLTGIYSITASQLNGEASDLSITDSGIQDGLGTNSKVIMWIASGTKGITYKIEVLAHSNQGEIMAGDGLLYVYN